MHCHHVYAIEFTALSITFSVHMSILHVLFNGNWKWSQIIFMFRFHSWSDHSWSWMKDEITKLDINYWWIISIDVIKRKRRFSHVKVKSFNWLHNAMHIQYSSVDSTKYSPSHHFHVPKTKKIAIILSVSAMLCLCSDLWMFHVQVPRK